MFVVLLAIESVALAFGIRGWWLFRSWDINRPEGFFAPAWLIPLLVGAGLLAVLLARAHTARFEAMVNLPLLVLILQPLKPCFFLANNEVIPTLVFALAASLVLRCVIAARWPGLDAARRALDRFAAASPRTQAWTVFGAALVIYLFLSSNLLFPVFPFTGDEPHYLILTHSIVHEGDTNLYDNYYLNKDYRRFYPGEMEAHTHAKDRQRQWSYSIHMPGTAVSLVPFYWVSHRMDPPWMHFFIRAGMSFYTALLVSQAFLLVLLLLANAKQALGATAILALAPPLVFYSRCVYPEVLAGLLMVTALRLILQRRRPIAYLLASVCLAAMPWLGTKYAIFAVIFTLVFAILRLGEGDRRITTYVVFLLPLALSAGLLLLFLGHYYGAYSPKAIYHPPWNRGPEDMQGISAGTVLERSRALLGYFYDQRVGLLVFSPIYLLAFPGAILFWHRDRRSGWVVAAIVSFYVLFYAWNMSWGGQAPPSRPMVSITPLLAVFIAAFLGWSRGAWKVLQNTLLVVTGLATLVLLQNSYLLYDTISNHNWEGWSLFLSYLSTPYLNLTTLVPQFLERGRFNHAAVWSWLGVFAVMMILFVRSLRRSREPVAGSRSSLAGVILICAGTVVIGVTNLLEPGYALDGPAESLRAARIHRMDSTNFGPELGGFWTKGGRSTEVLVESESLPHSIQLAVSSPSPNRLTLEVYNRTICQEMGIDGDQRFLIPLPWTYRWWDRKRLYRVMIRTPKGFVPRQGGDTRLLGVFVDMEFEGSGS
ncbi:MAG: hypothetical protein AB1714_12355 [Acidobacteriota bacterium]